MTAGLIVLIILALFVFIVAAAGVRIVPQARAGIVERLGRYSRTLDPGLTLIGPFVDRVKPLIDLREQVVSFPPQPVITEDNLVVGIDTVIYFTVTDPRAATYEVANPLQAIEQLTVTTLRNVIGGVTPAETPTSRGRVHNPPRAGVPRAPRRRGSPRRRLAPEAGGPPPARPEAGGHPRGPGGAEAGRAARPRPGGEGEADARGARPPRDDPPRRGRQAVPDPHRRGREAVRRPARRGPAHRRHPEGRGRGQ